MTFKITIERAPIGVEFEVGSISEAIAILEQEDTNLRRVVSIGDSLSGTGEAEQGGEAATGAEPVKRGRKPKAATGPDPATAQAPAPLPIPPAAAPPTAPVDMTPGPNGIPAALDRTNPAAVVNAAPPPPPPPPAAPVVVPPSGILAGKVIAALDQRATDDVNKNELVKWLAAYQIVNAGSSYDESIAAVRLMPDDKLSQVATALSVA